MRVSREADNDMVCPFAYIAIWNTSIPTGAAVCLEELCAWWEDLRQSDGDSVGQCVMMNLAHIRK
jgi:hypothetical protein